MKGSYFSAAVKESSQGSARFAVAMFALLAISFTFAGAWCLKNAVTCVLLNRAAERWPTAKGKITQASIRSEEQGRSEDVRTLYSPEVVVRFMVNDRWYGCDNLYYGYGSTTSYATVNRDIAGLTPGGTVDVHYNPSNPGQSMLWPGSKGTNVLFIAVGAVFLALGLGLGIPLFFGKPSLISHNCCE